ncbi:DUF4136 domain-containing protein [Pontibacter sp. HSC-14F20]|uniref:DUF4136 domain-containing protein n=1 Tax=Pontibacter sp. HSC-14F20 TaxID=2864136 RepID=UPI001C732D20|nr:DUF4136 domain-containing protein [Pontibacter sp. HSC-14F20]MBX0335019.1 DUF4136 domain-containing protein [Pontibacter sp. HSC-14F20]
MQTKLTSTLCLLLCVLFFSSCVATSGIENTNSISSSEGILGKKATYAWYQPKLTAASAYAPGFNADLHQHLLQAIEEELQRKGYTKTTVNPDMLVAYDVSVSVPDAMDKPELYGPGFGYSYAYMTGYRYSYGNAELPGYRAVDLFKQGTLIVDVINPKSKQLLWRGWTEGAIKNFDAGYSKVKSQVQEIVNRMPGTAQP